MIFIGGSQRSGTTLMQRLLCSHPKTNPTTREFTLLRFILETRHKAEGFWDDQQHWFKDNNELDFLFSCFLDLTFEHGMEHHGTEHLIFKEPHLTLYFPDLDRLMPFGYDKHFIVMVRDPRDVACSLVEVFEKLNLAPPMGERMGAYILKFYQSLENMPTTDLLVVRYEDLVLKTEETLKRVGNHVGLKLTPKLDEGNLTNKDYSGRFEAWYKPGQNVISTNQVGRWRQDLHPTNAEAIAQYCHDWMKDYGYLGEGHTEKALATPPSEGEN